MSINVPVRERMSGCRLRLVGAALLAWLAVSVPNCTGYSPLGSMLASRCTANSQRPQGLGVKRFRPARRPRTSLANSGQSTESKQKSFEELEREIWSRLPNADLLDSLTESGLGGSGPAVLSPAEQQTREQMLRGREELLRRDEEWRLSKGPPNPRERIVVYDPEAPPKAGAPAGAPPDSGRDEQTEALRQTLKEALKLNLMEDPAYQAIIAESKMKGQQAFAEVLEQLKVQQAEITEARAQAYKEAFDSEVMPLLKEYAEQKGRLGGKISLASQRLAAEAAEAQRLQDAMQRDPILQFSMFPQKSWLEKSAFVAAIMIANQAVYQVLLTVQNRDGDPVKALVEFGIVAGLVYFYGLRPF